MKKVIRQKEERNVKIAGTSEPKNALPPYLLDRGQPNDAKTLSSSVKNKENERAARLPFPCLK